MLLNQHPRRGKREAILNQAILAIAALVPLLVIRVAPPAFPQPLSLHHASVGEIANHSQRPHFDSDGSQWSAPVSHFLPFLPAAESAHLSSTSQLWSTVRTKGFHYNRPPPGS